MQTAVIIPCYRVKAFILDVIASIGPQAQRIFVVDDACPEGSGQHVLRHCADARVRVLFNAANQGVGGAVMTGYRQAMAEGFAIMVKLDGDGQMDASLIPQFIAPILSGEADYTKGNRFHAQGWQGMPRARLLCNLLISGVTKLSSGYWHSRDPANGFTAISATALRQLALERVHRRYFFESDMLFHLYLARAVVRDIPVRARYGSEVSGLSLMGNILPFVAGNARNFCLRVQRRLPTPAWLALLPLPFVASAAWLAPAAGLLALADMAAEPRTPLTARRA